MMRVLRLGCGGAVLAAIYLLFAGQTSPDEIAFGLACALIALVWAALVLHRAPKRLSFTPHAPLAILRALAALPSRTAAVGFALLRTILGGRLAGAVAERPFVPGTEPDPHDGGRRAAVVLALSLTPDSFVVELPAHRQELDLHRLIPTRQGGDARWPA